MIEKVTHVKNPLTIIAIFAGLSEISGTIVLPFLNESSQSLFVYFLIIFPILLIIFFFLTLNFNHTTLYAPSDYQNEDNFIKLFSQANPDEVMSGKFIEIISTFNDKNSEFKKNSSEVTPQISLDEILTMDNQSKVSTSEININSNVGEIISGANISENKLHSDVEFNANPSIQNNIEIDKNILDSKFMQTYARLIQEKLIDESRAISYIENIRGVKFQRNAKFLGSHDSFVFDGVYTSGDKIIVAEATFSTPNSSKIRWDFKKALSVFNKLPETEKHKFEFIYFIKLSDRILENENTYNRYINSVYQIKSEFPFETTILTNNSDNFNS